ncbi:hypothetical protein RUND412_010171 [Rhizina undulata]
MVSARAVGRRNPPMMPLYRHRHPSTVEPELIFFLAPTKVCRSLVVTNRPSKKSMPVIFKNCCNEIFSSPDSLASMVSPSSASFSGSTGSGGSSITTAFFRGVCFFTLRGAGSVTGFCRLFRGLVTHPVNIGLSSRFFFSMALKPALSDAEVVVPSHPGQDAERTSNTEFCQAFRNFIRDQVHMAGVLPTRSSAAVVIHLHGWRRPPISIGPGVASSVSSQESRRGGRRS